MSEITFLNDKFVPATLPDIYVPRHKLLNIFHEAVRSRLVYVSAPAGFGKTVSTLLWLNNSNRNTVWIGLDAYDNSISIFYKQFCTGILSVQPNNERMREILKNPSFSSSPIEQTINLLLEFVPDDQSYALVLDDVHLINHDEILTSLPFILKRLPHSFVKIILSRNPPSEEYITLAENKKAVIITSDNLMFTEDETRKYFISFGWFITSNEAYMAHAFTGGCAIGVNALAKIKQMNPEQSGSQVLENYIKNHIWEKWDIEFKKFILKTSVLDDLPLELCKRLTGREDSEKILEKLCSTNSFASKSYGDTYCYHHLFLDFLRNVIKNYQDIDVYLLYQTAAEYYIEKNDHIAARHYAIKSCDSDLIMQTIYQFSQYTNHSLEDDVNFSKVFNQEMMPESICDKYPFIYIYQIWISYLCGNASKLQYYLDKLYFYLQVIAQKFPQFLEISILEITLDHRVDLSKQIEQFSLFPPIEHFNDKQQGSSILVQMPFMHRSARDYYELTDEIVMEELKSIRAPFLKGVFKTISVGVRCGLLYECNRLKEALQTALQLQSVIDDKTIDEVVFPAFMHLAAIYYAMGNDKLSEEVIKETEKYIEETNSYYLRPNFSAYKTKIMLLDGNKAAAKEWLEHYSVTETEQLEFFKIFQHFTTARAYMVLSQTDKAMSLVLRLMKLGRDYRRPFDIAEAGVLLAVLEWTTGRRKDALISLETVLKDMQPRGFIRVIAEEGAAVLPVLKKVISKVKKADYQGKLDKKYLNNLYLAVHAEAKRRKGVAINIDAKPVRLSGQQKLMLILLSQGYKNAEIIEKTGLTINTVKAHTRIAYKKLDVNNAVDAVLKARQLRIIE